MQLPDTQGLPPLPPSPFGLGNYRGEECAYVGYGGGDQIYVRSRDLSSVLKHYTKPKKILNTTAGSSCLQSDCEATK